jgi:hypothetical protein
MTKGLVRKNNLSDLVSPERARINLGLASADYDAIRGLFTSAGVTNVNVQNIVGAKGLFQLQLDDIVSTVSGITPSLYVSKSGDTISGTWTNRGYIQASTFIQSGTTLGASSDALFTLSVSGLTYSLSTATLVCNNRLEVENLIDNGNVEVASGITLNKRVPFLISGSTYFFEAG